MESRSVPSKSKIAAFSLTRSLLIQKSKLPGKMIPCRFWRCQRKETLDIAFFAGYDRVSKKEVAQYETLRKGSRILLLLLYLLYG
jgi:hypothetical protein